MLQSRSQTSRRFVRCGDTSGTGLCSSVRRYLERRNLREVDLVKGLCNSPVGGGEGPAAKAFHREGAADVKPVDAKKNRRKDYNEFGKERRRSRSAVV